MTTRLRLGIVSAAAAALVVLVAAFAGAAQAQAPPGLPPFVGLNLQDMNVPYLAWRGEEVRLVKCATPAELGLPGTVFDTNGAGTFLANAQFVIEDWSGDQHNRPQFEGLDVGGGPSGTGVFLGMGEEAGRLCFATDIVSLKAGLAIVKLSVSTVTFTGTTGPAQSYNVSLKHQFLVAWMNIASANVEDIGSPTVNPAVLPTATAFATDATPTTTAAAANQIQIIVTGTIPMLGNFSEVNAQLPAIPPATGVGRPATADLVMPRDWAALAGVLARTSLAGNERNPLAWDIHDENTGVPAVNNVFTVAPPAESSAIHQGGGACPGTGTIDSVDNCLGGPEIGPFSRFIHAFAAGTPDMTLATIGPYDPKRQMTSYIPNGILDSGDAPMPAARIDVAINPNVGGTDIGGVGALVPIDKHVVYSRSGTGAPTAHNLWAPYYATFLPATAAERPFPAGGTVANPLAGFFEADGTINQNAGLGTTASGIDGPASGNNFHGFLNNFSQGGLYHFWDFAVAIGRTGAAFNCPPFAEGVPAALPTGTTAVTVYTDEHGEARVGFAPGTGFFFGNLAIVRNANGGCDIQGIATLGTAVIQAIARYPFQPITAPDVRGDEAITKTVGNLFNKQITCVPKGPGLANTVAFICTATARGIDGRPFVGERVCFISNAEAIMAAPGFTAVATPPDIRGAAVVCVALNAQGQAAVEIFGKGPLNVIANFFDEGLLRFISLAGQTLNPGGTPPANPPAPATQPVTSTTAPTQSQVVSLGGQTQPQQPTTQPATVQKPTLLSAKLVVKKGKRALVVRVRSTKPKAKIKVVLNGKKGTLATAIRSVPTNRAATVPNLRIPKGANRVTVSVIS